MGTIRKDGLCRKCLTAKANTSGYCSPCRRDLRARKLCINCKTCRQSKNGGGYCPSCRHEIRVNKKTCELCKSPTSNRSVRCNACERKRKREATACITCKSTQGLSYGRCATCRKMYRMAFLAKKYGISVDDVNHLYQTEKCDICCDLLDKPCIDHCHSTGIVRGILCMRCNTALGSFRDNPQYLKNAIKYLESRKPV